MRSVRVGVIGAGPHENNVHYPSICSIEQAKIVRSFLYALSLPPKVKEHLGCMPGVCGTAVLWTAYSCDTMDISL